MTKQRLCVFVKGMGKRRRHPKIHKNTGEILICIGSVCVCVYHSPFVNVFEAFNNCSPLNCGAECISEYTILIIISSINMEPFIFAPFRNLAFFSSFEFEKGFSRRDKF